MKQSQRDRMRILFKSRPNQEISLTEIADMRIMQYGRVISEIRKIDKMNIQNRTQFKNGIQHSWFKYIPAPNDYRKQDTFNFRKALDFVVGM